ncbi:MAG: ribosome biogenesis GTPase YlqF [Lachnospiraceae bacterium]|nr:ribosome biogenesis GTPase YlqF [Lachnospiraceae bacterium]
MNYEWYPGHMTAAIRMMRENLSVTDLVIEIADSRIPMASRNPDIDELCSGKLRLLVLAKSDLADPQKLSSWEEHFRIQGLSCISLNLKDPKASAKLKTAVDEAAKPRRERNAARGIKNQPIQAMVAGIPNVGKSTMINLIAGRGVAKTGNKPGVTRGKQWIRAGKDLQLLDSPGILWPRIGDRRVGELIALIGSMNDENLDAQTLSAALMGILDSQYPTAIADCYGFFAEETAGAAPESVLEKIAEARGLYGDGGRLLTQRAAEVLLKDFRNGRLGRMTLEQL